MRASDAVHAALKRRIILNQIKPETPLTELGIAQELGVSQGTVREALLKLQEEGLVLRSGHQGTRVTPLDSEVAAEMLVVRRGIETRAALRIAGTVDDMMFARLMDIQTQMDAMAATDDAYELMLLDTEFHMELFRLSGFQALEQILLRCILHSHRQKLWEPRHRRSLQETAGRHRQILSAIHRSGEELAAALGHHIDTIVDVAPERIAS